MREVNFSIPNLNKASVGITTALYDRRALDCTSTLPLINSLNHLAYLTTSSARIRDILTIDGGVERLVCILKAGRSTNMMDMWKWNLAFQCVVNIGVRGSENVRTRVVEADMVPVIATILDNYIKVLEKCRERNAEAEAEARRNAHRTTAGTRQQTIRPREVMANPSFLTRSERPPPEQRSTRRSAPPSIAIPAAFSQDQPQSAGADPDAMDVTPTAPQFAVTSPPERTTFAIPPPPPPHHHHRHHHHRSHDSRQNFQLFETALQNGNANRQLPMQPLQTAVPSMDMADGFGIRPVRDIDRLPSMVPGFQSGITSQPESPTTPTPPVANTQPASAGRSRRRPSIRHQRSMSGASDDANADELASDESAGPENAPEPVVDIQTGVELQDIEGETMLTEVETTLGLADQNASDGQDADTLNITHRSVNGSILNTPTPTNATIALSPAQRTANPAPATIPSEFYPRHLRGRPVPNALLVAVPREEDVLMSLQLLAYVSKYCNLRTYFQNSHLVPKLAVGNELSVFDEDYTPGHSCATQDEEEEYLVPDDFNIFPLVEKFTVRHHPHDMKYWAGVVMRNLCRKDDARGGIRHSPNADAADGQNTVAKSVKKVRGFTTVIGV
ncbi:MAG: hypothetical protein M1824_001091 [Vezdaea acicularis]|nr:MAG: hypothetical protein M1824_001091 [Vezdaea acicularis]